MPTLETAELTLQERGMLAASASAAYLDSFSKAERLLVSASQPVLVTRQRTYYSRGRSYKIEWQDYGQPLPPWFDPLMQGFFDLLTLPPNWNTYGSGQIDSNVVQVALNFVAGILGPSTPAPRVVPLSSGGVQIEWRRKGIDLEIVFDTGEQPCFYYRNRITGEESDHMLPTESALLRSIIAMIE